MSSPEEEKEIPTALRTAINLVRTLLSNSAAFNTQLERWLPVLTILGKLGKTSQQIGRYLYQFLTDKSDPPPHEILPLELLAELQAGFTELTEAFPDVSNFFLDTDKIDRFLADILLDPASALPGQHLLTLINEQSTRAIGKFVEITVLAASKDNAPSAEATHDFLARAEQLLDSILQRWILPVLDPTSSPSTSTPNAPNAPAPNPETEPTP